MTDNNIFGQGFTGAVGRRLNTLNLFVRLATAIVFLLLFAKLVEKNILFPRFNERHAQRIQKIFTEKEQMLKRYMDMAEQCLATNNHDSAFMAFHGKHADNLKNRGLFFLVYRNDTLYYWSTKDVAAPETFSSSELDKPYVSLGNNSYASGKYASFVKKGDGYEVAGLALIKNVYVYENKYLQTAFQKDFDLPPNVKIFSGQVPDSYPIFNSEQFTWSLIFDSTCFYGYQIYLPALAWLLAIFVLFFMLNSVFDRLKTTASRNIYIVFLAFLLAVVRLAMQRRQIPRVFYRVEIFTPLHFGSDTFPSLGELCLWCMFISFFVVELYRFLEFPNTFKRKRGYFTSLTLLMMSAIAAFFAISILLRELVINSSGIFETSNPATLFNRLGLLGYAIILLFIASFWLLLDKALQLAKKEFNFRQFLVAYVIILSATIIAWVVGGLPFSAVSVIFLSALVLYTGNIRLKNAVRFKYSHFILLVCISALFTSVHVNRYSREKSENRKKLLVTNLASQHDLTAEFLLMNISERIISDNAELAEHAYRDFFDGNDYDDIVNHIKKQYFHSSFWNRYIFRCLVCSENWQLDVGQPQTVNCVQYFKNMTETVGNKLYRSDFWYVERPNELSRYLGWFRLPRQNEAPLHLFVELWPGSDSDELGYPELLLDDRLVTGNNLKGYSYAKYRNNRRMTQSGEYRYNLVGDVFQTDKSDYHTVYADGMEHLVYRPDKDNMIALSSYLPQKSDFIFNFSYIFIFFLILVSNCLLLIYLPFIRREFQWNFRNKIQYSMIAVILLSFVTTGVFTAQYVNRQYLSKNTDIVNEKMRAIQSELSNFRFRGSADDSDREILFEWLSYFQRLFVTDVNVFDTDGLLIATSLPDIFDKGYSGRQINPEAYIKLTFGQRASIVESEDIGGMHYLSAYEILTDSENNVIAYLNLPYFTQQNALTEEISSVIMVLLNFYMIIILLTVLLSIAMSNQITLPLMMLQEKFKSIKLGAKNEPVRYSSRDELGGLVKAYNRAIEELSRSATNLARNERESAWREMARQIAHEINNPLTPMKLSIQHLKRAYDNKSEHFDKYMEKISHSLIEQIDNLSEIAVEFSNFAKMPAAQNEKIDLIKKITGVIPLFAVGDNKRAFYINFHGLKHATVFVDKEQISRVFVNLFKNALQAIPKDRQARIEIDVLKLNQIVWVRVKDNGIGISKEMQEKIFSPNFTTKSSGMGIGLSIVRNIIESAGGTINFKTGSDEGTTFIISLPAVKEN